MLELTVAEVVGEGNPTGVVYVVGSVMDFYLCGERSMRMRGTIRDIQMNGFIIFGDLFIYKNGKYQQILGYIQLHVRDIDDCVKDSKGRLHQSHLEIVPFKKVKSYLSSINGVDRANIGNTIIIEVVTDIYRVLYRGILNEITSKCEVVLKGVTVTKTYRLLTEDVISSKEDTVTLSLSDGYVRWQRVGREPVENSWLLPEIVFYVESER